jgi:hypothetical protein
MRFQPGFRMPPPSGLVQADADPPLDDVILTIAENEMAYGLRLLRAAYAGSAVRIRRSSDDTEQDIGFSGNFFDISAFSSFVGAGSGFVTTWYNQSSTASRDLVNATGSTQPQLILNAWGTRPCVRFVAASSKVLSLTVAGTRTQPWCVSGVALCSNTSNYPLWTGNPGAGNVTVVGAEGTVYAGNGAGTAVANAVRAMQFLALSNTSKIMIDGSLTTGLDFGTRGAGSDFAMGSTGFGTFLDGDVFELFQGITTNDWSDDFTDLDTNQSTYYGI